MSLNLALSTSRSPTNAPVMYVPRVEVILPWNPSNEAKLGTLGPQSDREHRRRAAVGRTGWISGRKRSAGRPLVFKAGCGRVGQALLGGFSAAASPVGKDEGKSDLAGIVLVLGVVCRRTARAIAEEGCVMGQRGKAGVVAKCAFDGLASVFVVIKDSIGRAVQVTRHRMEQSI